MGGKSDETYKGVAAFFNYLSQTEVQQFLHEQSGYLPVTMAAYEASKTSGFYEQNPAREVPITQMMGKAPTENSKGVRAPNLPQIRDILNEEFEKMLSGQQDAATAMKAAVERGNAAIRDAAGG
jgi:sn-glycerol 3-phosphate transport system substrate-binding protein